VVLNINRWLLFYSSRQNVAQILTYLKKLNTILMKRIIFFGLIFLSLTTFAQQTVKKQVDLKSDEQAIRSISMKWMELEKKHDAAGCAALFAEDGVSYSMNSQPAVGPAAITKRFTEDQAQSPKADINWTTERVEISASGDLAVEYGKYDVKGLGPNGSESDMGKYVTVYRKVNGTWKVAADIGTSTKPKETKK
jgi:uncharacterized protein (TIGR02246 family)